MNPKYWYNDKFAKACCVSGEPGGPWTFVCFSVELSPSFPQEAPVLTFQSIYHESEDKPYSEVHDGYPYSPRWSGSEMASRIKSVSSGRLKECHNIKF